MKRSTIARGFSLIELMIVVAVIAVLAAFAFPAYTKFRERGWRAEARVALLDVAHMLERNHTVNNTYNMQISSEADPYTKTGNHYNVTLNAASATAFTLTANLTNDTTCSTLTITNTGQRGASGASVKECWGR